MAYDTKTSAIDRWRREVASAAEPVVVPSYDRGFRRGAPEPAQVLIDDGLDNRTSHAPSSVGRRSTRKSQPRLVRLIRRASSDHGGHSRRRVASSPVRTLAAPTESTRRASMRPKSTIKDYPTTTTREINPQSATGTSLLPSTRSSRSRTIVYEKPRRYSPSPSRRYLSSRTSEPNVTSYSSRPRRHVSRKEPRRGSVDLAERMRLLDIRDRFREDVERARRWQDPPRRYMDYDRRSTR